MSRPRHHPGHHHAALILALLLVAGIIALTIWGAIDLLKLTPRKEPTQ